MKDGMDEIENKLFQCFQMMDHELRALADYSPLEHGIHVLVARVKSAARVFEHCQQRIRTLHYVLQTMGRLDIYQKVAGRFDYKAPELDDDEN